MHRHITPLLLFFLFACSSSDDANNAKDVPSANNQTNKKEHILSDQERMIQKAKDTEKKVKEAAEKQKKDIDDASK